LLLAHTLGEGGADVELLILGAGLLILAIILFFQQTTRPGVLYTLLASSTVLVGLAFFMGGRTADGPSASSSAIVEIVFPAEAQDVEAGQALTLDVSLQGGELTDATSSSDPDQGHLHIYVDGRLTSMPNVLEPEIPGDALDPGEHEIVVEFTQADHRSFEPPIVDIVNVQAQ
jgi:hypothetical protein